MAHAHNRDAILDFWDPLIRQEVIKVESSNVVCELICIVALLLWKILSASGRIYATP